MSGSGDSCLSGQTGSAPTLTEEEIAERVEEMKKTLEKRLENLSQVNDSAIEKYKPLMTSDIKKMKQECRLAVWETLMALQQVKSINVWLDY